MALPASPPISMAQVRAEFGGVAGVTKLSQYVRGGAYVPNIAANSGVPTSVPIRLAQLCGATNAALAASASPTSVIGVRSTPGTATSNSTTATVTGSAGTLSYSWSRISGDTGTFVSGSTATVTFSGTVNNTTPIRASVWRCTVTDSVLGTTNTNTVDVTLEYAI